MIRDRKEYIALQPKAPGSQASARDDEPGIGEVTRSISPFLALKSNRGVAAIEYGRSAASTAIIIILAVAAVGNNRASIANMIAAHFGNSPR